MPKQKNQWSDTDFPIIPISVAGLIIFLVGLVVHFWTVFVDWGSLIALVGFGTILIGIIVYFIQMGGVSAGRR